MQKEKGISTLVGIVVIIVIAVVAFGGVFAYQYFTAQTQPVVQTQQNQNIENKASIIEGISIEKPNLVVKGQNLSKVKIYFVPTGTGIDPETASRIENAVKQSDNNGEQVWTYQYPQDLLVTNIFAKGFDSKDNLIGKVNIPLMTNDLFEALYGINTTDQTAGWKTYTNAQYGFEMKYPTNWVIYKENSEIGEHSVFLGPEANYVKNIRTEESGCSVILAVFNNSEKLSLSDWLAKNDMWNQKPVKGITNIKINGAEGIKYEGTDYGMGGVTPIGFDSHVLFSKNDKIIDILTLDKCTDKINTDKINFTFKFTK